MNYIPVVLVGAIFAAIFRPSVTGVEYTAGPHIAYEIQNYSGVQLGARRTALAASLSAVTEHNVQFGVSWSHKGYTGCSEYDTGGEPGIVPGKLNADGYLPPALRDPPCKVGKNFDRTYTSVDVHGLWRPTRQLGTGPASAYVAVGAFAGIGVRCVDVKDYDGSESGCPADNPVGGVLLGTGIDLSLSERLEMTFGLRYRREAFGRDEPRYYHAGSLLGGVIYRLAR